MIFLKIKKILLDLLFPKRCLRCGEYGVNVCKKCLQTILFMEKQQCPNCRRGNDFGNFCDNACHKNFYFDQLIVCCRYERENLLKKMIVLFKYKFSEELSVVLGEILKTQYVFFSQFFDFFKNAVFVPVPLHKKRLNYRGFNQARLLADYLCTSIQNDKNFDNKFKNLELSDCLIRKEFHQAQAKLSKQGRLTNLRNAFCFDESFREIIKDKFVFLIDDVATTTTTLNECGKVLKSCGAKYICGLVLARGK